MLATTSVPVDLLAGRLRFARTDADLELREHKLEQRLAELEEREERLDTREQDLAGYVATVQQRFSAA